MGNTSLSFQHVQTPEMPWLGTITFYLNFPHQRSSFRPKYNRSNAIPAMCSRAAVAAASVRMFLVTMGGLRPVKRKHRELSKWLEKRHINAVQSIYHCTISGQSTDWERFKIPFAGAVQLAVDLLGKIGPVTVLRLMEGEKRKKKKPQKRTSWSGPSRQLSAEVEKKPGS